MNTFEDFKIKKQLRNAIADFGFEKPTPIQQASFSPILGGFDFVGISQTGTRKTIAYVLPILQDLKYSDQPHPRVLILVPTRELVIQIVEQIEKLATYLSVRVLGVYGGSNNINPQKRAGQQGRSILFYTEKETPLKDAIESLMNYSIPFNAFPEEVMVASQLTPEEENKPVEIEEVPAKRPGIGVGASFHEKSAKNSKVKIKRKSYQTRMKEKFKKPIKRGDKIQNKNKKRKR